MIQVDKVNLFSMDHIRNNLIDLNYSVIQYNYEDFVDSQLILLKQKLTKSLVSFFVLY
jgi:hypothetical protein